VQQGVIPSDWKKVHIVPAFKKEEKANPANYQPIYLSSVCRSDEHIQHSNIIKYLEHYNIECDCQYGFRKKRSCKSQLILTVNDLAKNTDNR